MHQTNDFVGFKNRRFFIKTQCHESKRLIVCLTVLAAQMQKNMIEHARIMKILRIFLTIPVAPMQKTPPTSVDVLCPNRKKL